VWLVNNLVFGNGTASGSTGGRFGVKREGSTSPQPAGITLLNNLLCGNRLGEIDGPALDATDSNNLTPTGTEGPGVSASPGCEVASNVYVNLNGPDGQPNTTDDDFTLATTSPAIDRGMDPRTLGLNPSFNSPFEADFSGEGRRPRDGNGSGTAEFDIGALEAGATARPTITNLNPNTGVHGQTITLLTVTGERLGGATALTFLKDGTPDPEITVTNIQVNAQGTELRATVAISGLAALGSRLVTVTPPEGTSDATATSGNTFTVLGQLTLVPDFMSLVEGQSGGLTVQLSAPAPTGGLTVTLESAAPGIATVPASVTVGAGDTSAPTSVTGILEGTANVTASASGFASGQSVVTVRAPIPTISSFNPSSGKVGTTVVIAGTGFRLTPSANTVRFTGPNSTWVAATVTAASSTSLTVSVPTGAVTGPLQVATSGGTATSTGHFIVLPTEDFQLSVAPTTVSVAASGEGAIQLTLSGSGGFTALTTLGVSGVPPGVSATFGAATLTASQSTFLRLQTSGTTPTGDHPLQVTATGPLNGVVTTRSASLTLQVQAPGVSSLTGQILTNQDVPIPNVRLSLGSVQGVSDAAGNFLLANVPAPPTAQPLSIDANVAVAGFPIYSVDVTLVAGQTTVLPPFRITPPPPASQFVPISNSTAAQVVTDSRYPGFSITLPPGVTITGWDGVVKSQIAIEKLTPDRLPVPPPPFATRSVYQIFFGTPMGGLPSAPLPVTLPNDQDMLPGDKANIWYYDAAPFPGAPGTWSLAGAGTVSADGSRVIADPGVGIERFCGVCGAICIQRQGERDPNHNPDGTKAGEPVDLATGLFLVDKTDLVLPGRFPIVFHRTYNPIEPFGGIAGFELGLGRGWALSLDVVLLEGTSSLRTLILPGNSRFAFPQQAPGTFVNTTHPRFAGAVLTQTGSSHTLRFKDGATWRFASGWLAGGFPIPGLSLVTEQVDRTGNRLLFTRDAQGKLLALTDPTTNRALELSYTGTRISQVQDPLGRRVQYSYDAQGRLETVTDPAGGLTRYTYDSGGRILTITDPRTITYLTNEYSPGSGRVLKQTQADGGIWLFKYQLQGATVTGPGCPGPTCPTEESSARVAQGYSFSGGFVGATTVVDPRGNPTTSRFTPDGFPRESTDPLGQTTRHERDAAGRLIRITDPLGRVTQFAYDASGNVTSITDPGGNVRTFTYDPTFNKVTSISDPLGNLTTFEYDGSGNLIAITDPEQNLKPPAERLKTTFTYNQAGQPLTTTDPLGNTTTFTYDSAGNLAAITDPLGNTTQRTYDLVSRLIAQTDALGRTTRFSYDALNRLVTIVDALNGQTTFGYDPNGNLLTVTDARGNSITHEYDSMDRLSRRVDQLGKAEISSYDGDGNLTSTTDRKNQTTTFTYDPLNRRTQAIYADGAVASFTYDAAGRLLQADDSADPHRPIAMTYDTLDRLLAETTMLGTVSYHYDATGRRTQMTVSGQSPVSYTYDAASRLRTITQVPLNPLDIQYDATGRRTLLTLPNGVSTEYLYGMGDVMGDVMGDA
jgi:YD repeat-containing protein